MKTSILLVLFTLSSAIAKKKMTEQFGIANQAKKYSNYEAFLLATKNSGVKKLSMGLLKVAAIGVNTKSENSDFTLINVSTLRTVSIKYTLLKRGFK